MTYPDQSPVAGAVETLVRDADIEIIPLKSAFDKLPDVPRAATVTVTCSTKLGLDRTLEFAVAAAEAGYRVVPHLAARQLTGGAELRAFVRRLDDAGITDLYVIGGDAAEPLSSFHSAADVLEELTEFDHGVSSLGVACYPEGHPLISDPLLSAALRRAQPHAHYMVSQLCFDHLAISSWLEGVRRDGIALPLHLGLAAPLQIRKLVELSLKIGVGSSVRYLTKQHGFVGNVLRGSSYQPDQLLRQLGRRLSFAELGIDRLHLFTFNQIAETVRWQATVAG